MGEQVDFFYIPPFLNRVEVERVMREMGLTFREASAELFRKEPPRPPRIRVRTRKRA